MISVGEARQPLNAHGVLDESKPGPGKPFPWCWAAVWCRKQGFAARLLQQVIKSSNAHYRGRRTGLFQQEGDPKPICVKPTSGPYSHITHRVIVLV